MKKYFIGFGTLLVTNFSFGQINDLGNNDLSVANFQTVDGDKVRNDEQLFNHLGYTILENKTTVKNVFLAINKPALNQYQNFILARH